MVVGLKVSYEIVLLKLQGKGLSVEGDFLQRAVSYNLSDLK